MYSSQLNGADIHSGTETQPLVPPAISHFINEIGTDLFACQTHFGSIQPATTAGKWVASIVCSLWHKSRKQISREIG